MVRKDDDPASQRNLSAFGRDVDVPESEVSYDTTTRALTIIGGQPQADSNRVQLVPPLDELTQIPNSDLMLAKPLGDWTYSKSIWSRFTKSGKQQQAANWLQRKGAVMYYIGGGIVTIIVIIIVVMLIF